MNLTTLLERLKAFDNCGHSTVYVDLIGADGNFYSERFTSVEVDGVYVDEEGDICIKLV